MERRLLRLEVDNFRSLRKVSLPLGDLNVLVGPNGAGKSNVLEVFRFLADIIRTDLEPALAAHHGYDEMVFRGGDDVPASIKIAITGTWTPYSGLATPDSYALEIAKSARGSLSREENFRVVRFGGERRRILVTGGDVLVGSSSQERGGPDRPIRLHPLSSGLATLPRVDDESTVEVRLIANNLADFWVFDVSVDRARQPSRRSRFPDAGPSALAEDASNLASFLFGLREDHEPAFGRLVEDAVSVLPSLQGIDFDFPSGAAREVVVVLDEKGLRRPTQMADASYGTIRLLGLLALLYDPFPPSLTCIEEIDHGLHPQALELLVERLREASERTQFIIATHSPAFADRLKPEELVVCERLEDGSSAIPAISTDQVSEIVRASEGLPLGELWRRSADFSEDPHRCRSLPVTGSQHRDNWLWWLHKRRGLGL